jgi:hypothetical protein
MGNTIGCALFSMLIFVPVFADENPGAVARFACMSSQGQQTEFLKNLSEDPRKITLILDRGKFLFYYQTPTGEKQLSSPAEPMELPANVPGCFKAYRANLQPLEPGSEEIWLMYFSDYFCEGYQLTKYVRYAKDYAIIFSRDLNDKGEVIASATTAFFQGEYIPAGPIGWLWAQILKKEYSGEWVCPKK